jgi:DNA-binding transcriptional LysR family regulator
MKPNQLRTFIAVVESKSIHRAALALGVSQPAVSTTIRDLEVTFGAPLLIRSSRGVEVTGLGAELLQRGRALLAHMERLNEEMARLQHAKTHTISVAVSMMVASWALPYALKKFRADKPGVCVRISEIDDTSEILDGLREGKFDFAAVHIPERFLPLPDDIEELAAMTMPVVIGCREMHPLAKATSLGDLIDADWIFPVASGSEADLAIRRSFAKYGLEAPRHPVHCNTRTVTLELFENMDFIGFFEKKFADVNFKRYGLVPVKVREALPDLHIGIFQGKAHTQSDQSSYLSDCFLNVFSNVHPLPLRQAG